VGIDNGTGGTGDGRRWPNQVYGRGEEPDPRFSFANERTFLAWIRTGLALLATGVALEGLTVPADDTARRLLVTILVALGAIASGAAFVRWARAELALRESRPLPSPTLAPLLAFGLIVVGAIVVVAVITS
jgi:putative membrane protein